MINYAILMYVLGVSPSAVIQEYPAPHLMWSTLGAYDVTSRAPLMHTFEEILSTRKIVMGNPRVQRVVKSAVAHGVPPEIALSVALTESSLRPWSVSTNRNGTRDYGVFQINDRYSAELASRYERAVGQSLSHREITVHNYDLGVWWLSELYRRSKSWSWTIKAYNAGATAVSTGRTPRSTQTYYKKVASLASDFRQLRACLMTL